AVRAVLRGVRGRCGLQALARQDGDRVRRPPVLPAHDEPPPAAPRRALRGEHHRLRPERRGGQLRLQPAAGDVGAGRLGQGDRQPRGGVAPAHGADLPRRHDLRRDRGARQDRVAVQGRPRRGARRDARLQAGRHGRLHLPAQGDGAQALLRRRAGGVRARRRAARPPRAPAL
ncbi:MAG: 2-methylfumaryl-CoA hydratase, partial [uncultured Pseudonocardia sp.]